MLHVNFNAYASYVTESLYQWDLNRELNITGLPLDVIPEIHFSNCNMDRAIVRQSTMIDGVIKVDIPNTLLQEPFAITVCVGIYEEDTLQFIERIDIPVIPRPRPLDYAFKDTNDEIYSFNKLENRIANLIIHNNDTNGNTELLDIRTDHTGTVHLCAGDAVRAQTEKVLKEIDELRKNGNVSDEQIKNAVDEYLSENPPMSGATAEQVEQIAENTRVIDDHIENDEVHITAEERQAWNSMTETASSARIGEVVLPASGWVGSGNLFSQVVNIAGTTENSQVDLTPSVQQLVIFYEKDLAFVTENDNGVVTVYAIGQKPQNDYTIQVTITEVTV